MHSNGLKCFGEIWRILVNEPKRNYIIKKNDNRKIVTGELDQQNKEREEKQEFFIFCSNLHHNTKMVSFT